jgi:hypothetical protein
MKKKSILHILIFLTLCSSPLFSQNRNTAGHADYLHMQYRFNDAIDIYKQLLKQSTDSSAKSDIEKKLINSVNGKNMLKYAYVPKMVARKKFSIKDFFLHYPGFENKSWSRTPASLLQANSLFSYIYFPKGAKTIYFSAPDKSGSWSIYSTTKLNESLWSAPQLLNESITSMGNDIFPYLSADGKSLYFSSNGHFGMGGYDLYVSRWSDEIGDWDTPQNLGFPFSSPADDFLYYDTPDGKYTIFASNRSTGRDSVNVYAIEYENLALKKTISQEEAANIALLNLPDNNQYDDGVEESDKADNSQTARYKEAVKLVESLQIQLSDINEQLSEKRILYHNSSVESEQSAAAKIIKQLETDAISVQGRLGKASEAMQSAEMDLILKGIDVPKIAGEKSSYDLQPSDKKLFRFASNSLRSTPEIKIEKISSSSDFSFGIEKNNSKFSLSNINEFPSYLVYQIQFLTTKTKASAKMLKGLTPVFERRNSSTNKYVYTVGLFGTYEEALEHLNTVKKSGFPGSSIVAFNKKKTITIKAARALEKTGVNNMYQVIITGYDEGMSKAMIQLIQKNTTKEIAKTITDGKTLYVIGPFSQQIEANNLAKTLQTVASGKVTVEKKSLIKKQ